MINHTRWIRQDRHQPIDVLHKNVYAFTTGLVADALPHDPPAWIEARG